MGLRTAVTVVIICCNLLLGLNVTTAARQLPDTKDGTGSNVGASLVTARPILIENSAEASTAFGNFRTESAEIEENSAVGAESPVSLNAPGDGAISPEDAAVTEDSWSSKGKEAEEDVQLAAGRDSVPDLHQIPQSRAESARKLQSLNPAGKGQMCRFGGNIMPIPCRSHLVCIPAPHAPSPSPAGTGPQLRDFATLGTCVPKVAKRRYEANAGELCRSGGAYPAINCAKDLLCAALPPLSFGFGPVKMQRISAEGGPVSKKKWLAERIWARGVKYESVGVCQWPGR